MNPITAEMVRCEILWNNKYITVDKKSLFYKEWFNNGIIRIQDLLNDKNEFMSHTQIESKYSVKCSFFNILQIRHSIPLHWRSILFNDTSKIISVSTKNTQIIDTLVDINKMTCKDLYWFLRK